MFPKIGVACLVDKTTKNLKTTFGTNIYIYDFITHILHLDHHSNLQI